MLTKYPIELQELKVSQLLQQLLKVAVVVMSKRLQILQH